MTTEGTTPAHPVHVISLNHKLSYMSIAQKHRSDFFNENKGGLIY